MNIFPSNEHFLLEKIVSPEFQSKISFQELLFIESSFFQEFFPLDLNLRFLFLFYTSFFLNILPECTQYWQTIEK